MTFPLTAFIIALLATPPERLTRADPERLAEKYGVRVDWCAWWIELRRGQG